MISILERAVRAWKEMEGYREDRRRCKRYVFGDQWGDVIDVGGGVKMTETEAIRSYGQIPLKNNILRRIMRNVIGVYRASHKMPEVSAEECGPERREEINRRGQEAWRLNRMDEMIPRLLEEFLLSGLTAVKVLPSPSGGKGEGKSGVILPVTADNFFFHSDGYDPRGWDVDLIGEMHCVSYGALMSRFCKSPDDLQRLEALYGDCRDNGKGCRLAEVWVREEVVTGCVHDTARGRCECCQSARRRRCSGKRNTPDGGAAEAEDRDATRLAASMAGAPGVAARGGGESAESSLCDEGVPLRRRGDAFLYQRHHRPAAVCEPSDHAL